MLGKLRDANEFSHFPFSGTLNYSYLDADNLLMALRANLELRRYFMRNSKVSPN